MTRTEKAKRLLLNKSCPSCRHRARKTYSDWRQEGWLCEINSAAWVIYKGWPEPGACRKWEPK